MELTALEGSLRGLYSLGSRTDCECQRKATHTAHEHPRLYRHRDTTERKALSECKRQKVRWEAMEESDG